MRTYALAARRITAFIVIRRHYRPLLAELCLVRLARHAVGKHGHRVVALVRVTVDGSNRMDPRGRVVFRVRAAP
jgi:hypothetical protein